MRSVNSACAEVARARHGINFRSTRLLGVSRWINTQLLGAPCALLLGASLMKSLALLLAVGVVWSGARAADLTSNLAEFPVRVQATSRIVDAQSGQRIRGSWLDRRPSARSGALLTARS